MDNLLYYFSATICFNLLYLIKLLSTNGFRMFSFSNVDIYYTIIFFLIIALLFIGFIASCLFFYSSENIKYENDTLGKRIKVNKIEDITSKNYFANYSLLVLTALNISTDINNVWSIWMYILVYFTLCIVYINTDMYYINPILYIFKYKLYKVNDNYYIISKKLSKDINEIKLENINSKIYKI